MHFFPPEHTIFCAVESPMWLCVDRYFSAPQFFFLNRIRVCVCVFVIFIGKQQLPISMFRRDFHVAKL